MERFKKLFNDKDGNVVIVQPPNVPILIWIALVIGGMVTHAELAGSFQVLSRMVLFAWAYLEISRGDSMFRRILGGIVALCLVVSTFS